MAETLSVTQATNLSGLGDGDAVIDPGEVVTTTVTITNNSTTTAATGVQFTENLNTLNGMTLVNQAGDDINVSPLAFNDSYAVIGNTTTVIGVADGVLSAGTALHTTFGADKEFFSATIGSNAATQTHITNTGVIDTAHGTVTLNADGGFSYVPDAGFTGTDTFTYTLQDLGLNGAAGGGDDLSDTATVTISVGPAVWFIDNTGGGTGGTGTQSDPFKTIADFNNANGDPGGPQAGDTIYLRHGTGTYSEADGFNLLNNQTVVGQGENLTITPTGGGPAVTIETGSAGLTPLVVVTGAGNEGVQLAQGNTLKGFDIGMDSATAVGIEDGGGTVGTLTISNVTVGVASHNTGAAIDIDQGGTLNVQLDSVTSSGAADGIDLGSISGLAGTGSGFTVSGTTTINDATANGIRIANSSLNATFTGDVHILNDAVAANGDGVDLGVGAGGANTGTYNFNGGVDITVNGTDAFGLRAQTSGTVNILNPDSDNQITSNNGTALFVNPTVFQASLSSVTAGDGGSGDGIHLEGVTGTGVTIGTVSLNGMSGDGIEINGGSAAVTINGGTIGNTNDPGGNGVNIDGGTGAITIAASVTKAGAAGTVVDVNDHETGNVTFSGNISSSGGGGGINVQNVNSGTVLFSGATQSLSTGTGTGVNLTGNTGGTITFNSASGGNGLDITTTSGTGFNATGGGTVNVLDPSGSSTNSISSTTGTALNIANTTIGASDVTFQSISANGAVNGIVLNSTGTSGGLTVTGSGTTVGAGGTIQNTTGVGISLTNTADVSLNGMTIANTGSHGVSGTGVTNVGDTGTVNNSFSFTNGLLDSPGDGDNESALFFDALGATNITGRMTLSGTTIQNFEDAGIILGNVSGSLVIDVTNTIFNNNSDTTGEEGIDVDASGTANIQLNVTGTPTGSAASAGFTSTTQFTDLEGGAINGVAQGSGVLDVNLTSVLITNTGGPDNFPTPPDLTFSSEGSASTLTFDITGNRMVGGAGDGIFVGHEGHLEGRIVGNAIQTGLGDGIRIDTDTSSTTTSTILIQNNDIGTAAGATGIGDQGIQVLHRDGTKVLNLTIDNNRIGNTLNEGIRIFTDDDVAGGGPLTRTSITNNQFSNISPVIGFSAISMASQDPGTETFAEITGNTGVNSITLAQSVGLAGSPVSTLNIEQASQAALAAANGIAAGNVFQSGTINYGVAVTVPLPTNPLMAAEGGVEAATPDTGTPLADNTPSADTDLTDDTPPTDGAAGDITPPTDETSTPPTGGGEAPVVPAHPVIVDDGVLSQAELDYFVEAAIARWEAAGISADQLATLQAMHFTVADMAGLYLGSFAPGAITLDADAAGKGWFLDGTPADDAEFGNAVTATQLQTDPSGAPAGHYDLLTTVMHEMGHALGLGDSYDQGERGDLMYGWLFTGERRLPGAGEADGAVTGSIQTEEFLGAPVDIGVLPVGEQVTIQWQATIDPQTNKLITNPVNSGTVSATNAGGQFPDAGTGNITTTLDTLVLGGTIWNDNGAGGGITGNGIKDGTEAGISGVTLSLFVDANNDDVPDTPGTPLVTGVLTNGSGNYSFTGLAPGNYIVRVDQDNFDAGGNTSLLGLPVSPVTTPEPPDPDNNTDNDDNGARVTGQPAFSKAITLAYNDEPTNGTGNDTNNTLDFGFFSNPPPSILNLGGDTSTFTEEGPAVLLDAGTAATVTDDQTNFNGGSLTVSITANEVAGEDVLGISTAGTVTLSDGTNLGSVVSVGGQAIGSITANGTGGNDLVVTFNTTNATPASVGTLVNALTYSNSNTGNPSTTARTIAVTVNDGLTGTDSENVTVTVTPVNDAPVAVITPTTYSATEQTALSLKNNGLSVSDVDGNSGSETITLSVTEGTLTVTAGTSGVTGITGNGTGSVTVSGTIAQLNDFLNTNATSTLSYIDNTDTPSASATLTLIVHDNGNTGTGGDLSASDTATIDITAVNDAPVALLGTDPYAATENVARDIKNTGMSVSDVDAGGGVVIATLSVAQGILNVSAGTSGVTVGGDGTGSVTLTGTLAQINALLNTDGASTVSYTETNDNPAATVTLTLQVDDQANTGTGGAQTGTDTSTINITAVNDAPVATTPVAHYTVNEQTVLSLKNTGLSVNDVDGNSGNETITLSVTEGTLTVAAGSSGVSIDSGNGTNSVVVSGTIAQLNDFLNTNATSTLSYSDNTDTPSASATLTLLVHDNGNTGGGDLSASDTATIDITAVNDAPVALMTTDPYAATEQTTLVLKGTGLSVSDADSLGGVETITLSVGEGALTVAEGDSGVTVVGGNGTASVQVSGTIAQLNALLAAGGTSNLTYFDNGDNPAATTTLTLQVDDGGNTGTGGALTGTDTSTINMTAVNDAPVSTITPTSYGGVPNVAIDLKNNGLSVADVDGNSGSETVTLSVTSGTLTVTAGGSGVGVAGSGTGSVTITGTVAQINALLNTDAASTVSFLDSAGGPRTLTLLVHDNGNTGGGDLSASDTATINVDQPPVLSNAGDVAAYTEQQASPAAVVLDGDIAISDADAPVAGDQINSATVRISAGFLAGDALNFTDQSGIAGSYNGGTGELTLTGPATIAEYEAALRSITFSSSSDNPTAFGTDTSRTITWTVKDDLDVESSPVTSTVAVTAVNDAPDAEIAQSDIAAVEQVALDLKTTGMSVSDVDGGGGQVYDAALSVVSGVLTVTAGTSGVSSISGSGTGSVSITGTLAQINALLSTDATSTVSYVNNSDNPAATVALGLAIVDNGHTGGGDLIDFDGLTIHIQAVNDAPTLAGTLTAGVAEGGNHVITTTELGFSDPDDVAAGVTFITSAATNGTILVNGVASLTFNGQQVANGQVSFLHDGSETATASFNVTVEDGDEDVSAPPPPQAFTLNVTAVNDAPSLTVGPSASFTENGAAVTLDPALAISDVDNGPGYSATIQVSGGFHAGDVLSGMGSFDAGTHTFTTSLAPNATLADLQAALQAVTFSSTSDNPTADPRTLTWTINDGSGVNATFSTQTTVNVTPVNDAPAGTDKTITALEDRPRLLTAADFPFTDAENNTLAGVIITTLPGAGTLTNNGVAVAAGQEISIADINAGHLAFQAALNANGAAYASFTFQVRDNGGTLNGGVDLDASANTMTVNVAPVNDPATIALSHIHGPIAENASTVPLIKIADITVTDIDGGPNLLSLAGADAALFRIIAGDLYLRAGAHLDFETNPRLDVTVRVNDPTVGGPIDDFRSLSIAIIDKPDVINGDNRNNVLIGTDSGDTINGLGGNDVIVGRGGDDRISGGTGRDIMRGGPGNDVFVFTSIRDSAPGQSGYVNASSYGAAAGQGLRDIIIDFTHGQDRIDLSAIDANTRVAGNQAFSWHGTGNLALFRPGWLIERIYDAAGTANDKTVIYGDVNGDARADFQIELTGLKHLVATDFVL